MKIMIFLHGTATMHSSGLDKTPAERIKQVEGNDPAVQKLREYIHVGNSNEKIRKWQEQGAEIVHLSSNRTTQGIQDDLFTLQKHNFPKGKIYYKENSETYADVAERVMPDI